MSNVYAVNADGSFGCKKCGYVSKTKGGAYSHYRTNHDVKKAKTKKKKMKGETAPKGIPAEYKGLEKFNKTREQDLTKRIKFCPECGHEIPTGFVYGEE